MSLNIEIINNDYCKQCTKVVDEKYIVNLNGDFFCSEDCMESSNDFYPSHPYEDQYLSIRTTYIELLENWEEKLASAESYLEDKVDSFYEEIDEVVEAYSDFINTEGDDGVFANEIYQYTLKLKALQKKIFAWRPARETYYWISSELGLYGSDDIKDKGLFDKITTALYMDGYGDDLLEIVKNYAHPYHWGCNLVLKSYEDALEVYEVTKPYFDKYEQDLNLIESHRCEAGCGDIVSKSDDNLFINGWFYCYTHSESGDYGIYSEIELTKEINSIAENSSDRQTIIDDKADWCYPFKEKIKRSCRTYQIEIPDWAY